MIPPTGYSLTTNPTNLHRIHILNHPPPHTHTTYPNQPYPFLHCSQEEIDFTLDLLAKHVGRLREMSPLWEMVQEGIDLKSIQWTQDASHHHH